MGFIKFFNWIIYGNSKSDRGEYMVKPAVTNKQITTQRLWLSAVIKSHFDTDFGNVRLRALVADTANFARRWLCQQWSLCRLLSLYSGKMLTEIIFWNFVCRTFFSVLYIMGTLSNNTGLWACVVLCICLIEIISSRLLYVDMILHMNQRRI
jgi:hypothetical protein